MKSKVVCATAMASVALGVLAYSNVVLAQSSTKTSQDASSTQEAAAAADTTLGEIIVTAQFRSQNLQDAPLAISAVTGEMAAARGQLSITDIAKAAPSVNIEAGATTGGSFPTVFIRGIGQSDAFPPLDPGVGIYIDDVYYGITTGSSFDLLDMDRVEILRGPQGTLAGKNSEGGAIKLFTKQPTNDFGGYAEVTYGSYDRKQLRGAVNAPLIEDKVLLRVSGVARHVDGFFKQLDYGCVHPGTLPLSTGVSITRGCEIGRQGGGDLTSVKATLLIRPTDNVQDSLSATKISDHQETLPAKLLYESSSWNRGLSFITGPRDMTSYATFVGNAYTASQYQGITHNNVDQTILSNTLDIDFANNLHFKSITGYIKTDGEGNFDNDVSPISVSLQEILIRSKQFTQEIRLSGTAGTLLDWTLGAYYFDNDIVFPGRIDINRGFDPNGVPGFTLDFLTNDPISSKSKSGFAHGVLHLTDRFNVTGGVRYTDDSKSYTFVRLGPDGGPVNPLLAPVNGVTSKFSGKRWDYRGAVDYRFNPEFLVYAQVATGYKGGGVNPRPIFASQAVPFEPETVRSYEAGFKSDLFDRRVRLNAAGFYEKFSAIQLPLGRCDSVSPFPGAPCNLTTNAGKARIWGAEVEIDARPVERLSISASASYVDFKFTETNPDSGVRLTDTAPFVSKYKLALGAQYEIPAFGGTVIPRIDFDYRSSFTAQAPPFNDLAGLVGGRTLVNARLSYETTDKNWVIAVAATNLLDKYYYATKFDQALESQGGSAAGIVGRPRELSVTVKRNF